MTQKKVDAIVLEIFNICREKGLNFEFNTHKVNDEYLDKISVIRFDSDYKIIFKVEVYINVNCSLFNISEYGNTTIQDALKQVKQYKK